MKDDEAFYELAPWPSILVMIGAATASRLSAEHGGRRLYIPKAPGPHHPLSQMIGHDLALAVGAEWGGHRLDVPLTAGRRARIVELRATHYSVSAIASIIGCTERHVYQVLADDRFTQSAPDLFSR